MVNTGGPVARRYHDLTVHTPDSVRAGGHTLDWDNKPFPFKVYTDIPGLPLPREVDVLATPTLAAVAGEGPPPPTTLTLGALASLLYYAAGVTRQKSYPGGGQVLFRAAASTGALYQTEVYVVAGDVQDLLPGVYHFCPGDFTLRRLRDADARAVLAEAAADHARAVAAVARRGGRAARRAGPRGLRAGDARRGRALAARSRARGAARRRPDRRAARSRWPRGPRARRDDSAARLHAPLRADVDHAGRARRRALGGLAARARRRTRRAGRHLYERPCRGRAEPRHVPLSPRGPRAGAAGQGRLPAPGGVPHPRAGARRRRRGHAVLPLAPRSGPRGVRRARLAPGESRGGTRGRPCLPRGVCARLRRERAHVLRRGG